MVLEALRKDIKNNKYQAIMLTGLENPKAAQNLRYVTGYTGTYGVAIITEENQFFISDFRYRDQVQNECKGFDFVEVSKSLLVTVKQVLDQNSVKCFGFDKNVRYSEYEFFKKLNLDMVPLENTVENLRIAKQEYELERLQKACEITQKV